MINRTYLPKDSFHSSVQQGDCVTHRRLHTWRTHSLAVAIILSILLSGLAASPAQAQSAGDPPLTITEVDTSQFPTVKLTLSGSEWPAERAAAPPKVLVNGTEQTLLDSQTAQQGISFLVAIDPNEILTLGQAGQSRYVQLTGALLNLVENGILLRNQDWMAAYLLAPEQVQDIQTWTQEPNLVFNSIVQNRPAEVTDSPLAAPALINVLQQFKAEPVAEVQPRTLMLISAGADALDVAAVATAANELGVHIHAVELVNDPSSSAPDSPLGQLAQETGGQYVAVSSPNDLAPLWERLAAEHHQRVLTFTSSIANPASLEVLLQLPTGATVSATAEPTVFAGLPTVAPTATPATEIVLTSAEAAPVANAVSATTNTQSTAPQAATVAQPAATDAAPAIDSSPAETPSAIVIPGLQLALPRGLLQISLPILLLLIGYFVYAETRDRRRKRGGKQASGRQNQPDYTPADPHFALNDNSQPLSGSRFQLNDSDSNPETGFMVDQLPAKSAPPVKITPPPARSAAPRPPARPPVRQSNFTQDDDSAELTMRPPRMEDEEATYRVQEVEQPVIGYLVRATSDPNLPKELPIYGLNPAPGEVRQIHIGRHSKHNTVVINDKSVSREHAVIVQREGRLYLRDNASTSGTFLNWKRLNPGEELLLRHNDLISFGQIVYEFRLHGEDEATIAEA